MDQKEPDEVAAVDPPVRGLITTVARTAAETQVRRYPGVLEPGEVNTLSFEVGGRLGEVSPVVGKRIERGELLAALDSQQFQVIIDNRAAAVDRVAAELSQAREDLARSETLLKRGVISRVQRDTDRTTVATLNASLVQAQKDLASAQEDKAKAKLYAPFDGVVNAVDVESFATVSAGQSVLSLYQETAFEVSFSVSFDVVSRLVVGTPARVRLADDPNTALSATVSELGERAETVSSFPVVVLLAEVPASARPGMAVEVSFSFELPGERGFLIPISAAAPGDEVLDEVGPDEAQEVPVFVYDPDTSTVRRRLITFAGLRENDFLVIDGLTEGERVATAGVSFLREGMQVKLHDSAAPR